MSPDGQFVLVARIKRPFSRLVTAGGFAKDVEIWSRKGVLVRKLGEEPLAEGVPIGGVNRRAAVASLESRLSRRRCSGPKRSTGETRRTRCRRATGCCALKAPFSGEPDEYARTEFRFGGVSWTEKGIAMLSESDRATRVTRTWLIDAPGAAPRKLWERKQQDRYTDPGHADDAPGHRRHPAGRRRDLSHRARARRRRATGPSSTAST